MVANGFTVCLLLHLFQSDLESNTEVLEKKKKNTLWARFWHCILSEARSRPVANARWKNHKMMS